MLDLSAMGTCRAGDSDLEFMDDAFSQIGSMAMDEDGRLSVIETVLEAI